MKLATHGGDLASAWWCQVPQPAEAAAALAPMNNATDHLPRLALVAKTSHFALTGPLADSDAGTGTDTGIITEVMAVKSSVS